MPGIPVPAARDMEPLGWPLLLRPRCQGWVVAGRRSAARDATGAVMSVDNREALAYVVFKHAGVSRDLALKIVDEQARAVAAVERALPKRWRQRRSRP